MPAAIPSPSSAASGEIGRNCMVLEQEDRPLLIDCGLMFPDADMHGIDLVLPDFTYLRENADRIEGSSPPTATRTTSAVCRTCCATLSLPDLRLGAHARPGPQPHRGGRPARPDRPDPGRRRRAPPDRPVRRRVHPGHPLGAPRASPSPSTPRRASILHSGDFKLDLTPGRRPPHRPRPHRRHRRRRQGIRLLLADSTNAEEHGYAPSETLRSAACCARCSPSTAGRRIITASFASHIHRIQQIADAAIAAGRMVATLGLSHEEERPPGPRPRACSTIPDASLDRHRGHRRLRARAGVHHLHRLAGRADVGPGALARGENKLAQGRRARHGDPLEPRHPGQRVQRQPGDRRAAAPRAPRSCTPASPTCTPPATPRPTSSRRYLSIAKPEWFVPIHGEYRHMVANAQLGELMGVPPRPHRRCARTAT